MTMVSTSSRCDQWSFNG